MSSISCHILLHDPLVATCYGYELVDSIKRTTVLANGAVTHLFVKLQYYGPALLEEISPVIKATVVVHPNEFHDYAQYNRRRRSLSTQRIRLNLLQS